jgi:hypothetical protein
MGIITRTPAARVCAINTIPSYSVQTKKKKKSVKTGGSKTKIDQYKTTTRQDKTKTKTKETNIKTEDDITRQDETRRDTIRPSHDKTFIVKGVTPRYSLRLGGRKDGVQYTCNRTWTYCTHA